MEGQWALMAVDGHSKVRTFFTFHDTWFQFAEGVELINRVFRLTMFPAAGKQATQNNATRP